MKAYIITVIFVLVSSFIVKAQNLIAVQNGGTPKFYTDLTAAIANAINKDTIYIPGSVFQNIPDQKFTINKELHLVGVGHHPDSAALTNPTCIIGNIYVITGASKSSFEGLYLKGDFRTGSSTANEDVDEIEISRCNIEGVLKLSCLSTSWMVLENIIKQSVNGYYQSSNGYGAQNNLFSNNIFAANIYDFGPGNQFRNNISIAVGNESGFKSCVFENNIFFGVFSTGSNGLISCTFNNNIFLPYFPIPDGQFESNNISNQTQESIFVNSNGFAFSYNLDYHLIASSPGKNAGRDGTDIGIYGGLYPWKAGSVPTNPHIQFKQVSGTTDINGNLNVKIKVAAQDH